MSARVRFDFLFILFNAFTLKYARELLLRGVRGRFTSASRTPLTIRREQQRIIQSIKTRFVHARLYVRQWQAFPRGEFRKRRALVTFRARSARNAVTINVTHGFRRGLRL